MKRWVGLFSSLVIASVLSIGQASAQILRTNALAKQYFLQVRANKEYQNYRKCGAVYLFAAVHEQGRKPYPNQKKISDYFFNASAAVETDAVFQQISVLSNRNGYRKTDDNVIDNLIARDFDAYFDAFKRSVTPADMKLGLAACRANRDTKPADPFPKVG